MLTDFTIVDLTEGAAGPFCTKLFADYGARVIKVERPGRGDPARRVGPFPDMPNPDPSAGSGRSPSAGSGRSHSTSSGRSAGALFLFLNTGKESITVDLATTTGHHLLLELVEHADALIEGFPPDYLDARGLGVEALHQRNPRLIITSVTAFGQSGQYASHHWSELTAFAAGGQMSLCGNPDREPLMPAGHQGSYQAGIHAFGATLAGLLSVGVIETGQHIDIAEMECLASTLELYLPDYTYVGREILTKRRGNILSPTLGIFPCADGYVGVHVMSRNFPSFARVMGEEWMIDDERFQSERGRLINSDEIMAHIYAWAADRTREEIYRRAGEERSTIAPVLAIPEVPEQPQMRARKAFRTLDDSRAGPITYTGPPFRPSEGEWELRPSPRLGEHNAAVYGELLGLSPEEIVALRQAGVI